MAIEEKKQLRIGQTVFVVSPIIKLQHGIIKKVGVTPYFNIVQLENETELYNIPDMYIFENEMEAYKQAYYYKVLSLSFQKALYG